MPTTVVPAETKKGAVVKANAPKASAKPAVAKTTVESSEKVAAATGALPRATAAKHPCMRETKPGGPSRDEYGITVETVRHASFPCVLLSVQ